MDDLDVVVVGAGLSGLATARELSLRGLRVLLADKKTDLGLGIHTSGIFPRRTLESFFFPESYLGAPVSQVVLHSPRGRRVELHSRHVEYRLGDMPGLYGWMLERAVAAGVEWAPAHTFERLEFLRSSLVVEFRSEGFVRLVRTRFLVGADGAKSPVARSLRLESNVHLLAGTEEVYWTPNPLGEPCLHCFVDPQLAPGYLGWLVQAGSEIRLGVAGHAGRFSPSRSLETLRRRVLQSLPGQGLEGLAAGTSRVSGNRLAGGEGWAATEGPAALRQGAAERRSGLIPVGGILGRIAHRRGLLVGDAAGVASPLTGGGLDPCLRLAPWVADAVAAYLREGREEGLSAYSAETFRGRFLVRRAMRVAYSRLSSPFVAELCLAALKAPLLNLAARRVFFGEGSFPDCVPLSNGWDRADTPSPAA